ncbi:MAG: glycosyltransferase family 4 protein [Odoribacter sp.]
MADKKILILTYYWPPAGGPGVQRWLKFAKYLPESGYQPIILTVDPLQAEYPLQDESLQTDVSKDLPVFRTNCSGLYEWYKKFTKSKTAPYSGFANEHKPNLKQKIARFIRGNFFLPDARRGWNYHAYSKAIELIREYHIQTIITTGPPMSTHLIGLKLQKTAKINWIADFRDPWTDIYYYHEMYPTWLAQQIDAKYERQVLIKADSIITVSPFIKEQLASKSLSISKNKIKIIPNGYDESDFLNEIEKENIFTVTYTGTIAASYTMDAFLMAVKQLSAEIPLKIKFIGKISPAIAEKIKDSIPNNIELIDSVPHQKSVEYLKKASVLLLIIPNITGNKGNLTGKLFEYIGSRVPILCIGPTQGDAATIIDECQAGECFDYLDQNGMYHFLKQQYFNFQQPEKIVKNTNVLNYSRRLLTNQLNQILNLYEN